MQLSFLEVMCLIMFGLKYTVHPEWSIWYVVMPLIIQVCFSLVGLIIAAANVKVKE